MMRPGALRCSAGSVRATDRPRLLAALAAAGGPPAAASAESSSGRSVSVTLNAEQRKALGSLLERFVLTEAGPPAVYRLTETQLHDFLAELERLDIAATVTEPSDGKASGGGLLYVSPAD